MDDTERQKTLPVVLVVGASRGIGAAIAARYARAGDTVAGTHRGGGLSLPDDVTDSVLPVSCDVRYTDSIKAAFTQVETELGKPEIVVYNAAVTADKLLVRMDDSDWDLTLDTNLSGAFRVARRATMAMMKARAGSIVFISSAAGAAGAPGQVNYAAAKAGLVGLARSMVLELGSRGVRVNVVAPGPTQTEMTATLTDVQREAMRVQIPLARFAEPDEIAEVVEWVSRATFMSGAVVGVDGGAGMGK